MALNTATNGHPAAVSLTLPVQGQADLPGGPLLPFISRLNQLRAAHCCFSNLLTLALGLAIALRCWRLMTPLSATWMAAFCCMPVASIAWRRAHPESFSQWREAPAALLSLFSFGLGPGWLQTRRLLDDFDPPQCTYSGATLAGIATHVSLLLFASGAMGMAAMALSLRVRLSLSVAIWLAVACNALQYTPHICGAAPLAHPTAQRLTHHTYEWLSILAYLLPQPLSVVVQHGALGECATVIRFFQFGLGLLAPQLAAGLSEARLFQRHQQQRRQAGLPPERGVHAAVYDFLWWLMLGGSGVHTSLVSLALLAACWDWCAFFTSGA